MFFKKDKKNDVIYEETADIKDMALTTKSIMKVFEKCNDVYFQKIFVLNNKNIPVTLVYINGISDKDSISEYILEPLLNSPQHREAKNTKEIIEQLQSGVVYYATRKMRNTLNSTITDILNGYAALIFDEDQIAITFNTHRFEKRSITEPSNENTIKGAKDSFVESMEVNLATIRSRIKSPKLAIEEIILGEQTNTTIHIVYLQNIANHHIIDAVHDKLSQINIDSILNIGTIEEAIINNKLVLFPQVLNTERPDIFCSNIVDGRVGIIVDGLPVTIIVPVTLSSFFQSPDDYANNAILGSLLRLLRYFLFFVSLVAPGLYIAITTYHIELLPTELIISISDSKEGVPFPIFFEVLLMLIGFETLIEAGLRLPKNIGQAVSIVGALVVGQSAVEAKFVSPGVVMIIAITIISNFTMPNQDLSNALRVWRFVLAVFSTIIGFFGIAIGGILMLYNLAKIDSFGVSYLDPFSPDNKEEFGDVLIRLPIKYLNKRPYFLKTKNQTKEKR